MWFDEPPRFDDWLLYCTEGPVARSGRGLAFGHIYTQDGTCVATAAQEGVLRVGRNG